MNNLILNDDIKKLFTKGKKCIINTDLDGILSGMLLQYFLNWDIVGYSSCCGKPTDELWLKNADEEISDCVFIDLPVYPRKYSVIDQHFIAFDSETINTYNSGKNKVNPNVIDNKVFKNSYGSCEYTSKYPFGTIHFVLALLEHLGYIDKEFKFDFNKRIVDFDLADLVLRADRVIGNTYQYTQNCIKWIDWIMNLGGSNTKALFVVAKNEYIKRFLEQKKVERHLLSLGCNGIDGDCSDMFRFNKYKNINDYFSFLSVSLNMPSLPLFDYEEFGKLHGKRFYINEGNFAYIKKETEKNNVFSFAFVTMKALSLTYIDE